MFWVLGQCKGLLEVRAGARGPGPAWGSGWNLDCPLMVTLQRVIREHAPPHEGPRGAAQASSSYCPLEASR